MLAMHIVICLSRFYHVIHAQSLSYKVYHSPADAAPCASSLGTKQSDASHCGYVISNDSKETPDRLTSMLDIQSVPFPSTHFDQVTPPLALLSPVLQVLL